MIVDLILVAESPCGNIRRNIDAMSINTRYIKYMRAGRHESTISIKFHLYSGEIIESYSFRELEDCIETMLLISALDLIEVRFLNGNISFITKLDREQE